MKVRQHIYDQYWRLAYNRQEIFFNRLSNKQPYTHDPILQEYKFCNAFRASDRVSQFLISSVIYQKPHDELTTIFRIFLFRLLNKTQTWDLLELRLGDINLQNFDLGSYSTILDEFKKYHPIYGNAFILCANKAFGYSKKHQNHLALLEHVFLKSDLGNQLAASKTLKELFLKLKSLPLIGDFMAYQIAIDLNYSDIFNFSENDFTIAGPGAVRGIKKCFENIDNRSNEYVIKYMVDHQDQEFKRLGLKFKNLFGRDLHSIDCQGLFCETDKYTRVSNPELISNRKKIKTRYKPTGVDISYFYPPKWKINTKARL